MFKEHLDGTPSHLFIPLPQNDCKEFWRIAIIDRMQICNNSCPSDRVSGLLVLKWLTSEGLGSIAHAVSPTKVSTPPSPNSIYIYGAMTALRKDLQRWVYKFLISCLEIIIP